MRLSGTRTSSIHQYRGLGDQLWDLGGARPTLDLNFAHNKSLVDSTTGQNLITFTRASSGTYVGSDGVLKTATTNEARFDHNPTTGESLGLLVEEQRTNLLLNSGTLSTQNVTVTAVAHTLSFTGTGTITLSGTSTAGPLVGTGTGESNRVSLTFTPTAGTLTLTVSGTVTNAQLEAGSFRTSYIPTTGATATRSADVASITGTNFSSWYRQDEGTVFLQGIMAPALSRFPSEWSLDDGTANDRIGSYNFTNGYYSTIRKTGEVSTDPALLSITPTSGTVYQKAVAIKSGDYRVAAQGQQAASLNPAFIPSVSVLRIGTNHSGGAVHNSTIRRLTYWPTRLSDTTLQKITQ